MAMLAYRGWFRIAVATAGLAVVVASAGAYRWLRAGPAAPGLLSERTRRLLWETENRAFQLSRKGAPRLHQALAQGNLSGVVELLSSEFRGAIPPAAGGTVTRRAFAEFRYQHAGDRSATTSVDRAGFAQFLVSHARGFRGEPRVQSGLLHCSPDDPRNLAGPWHGVWSLRLFGEAQAGRPAEVVLRGPFRADRLPDDFTKANQWISAWEIDTVTTTRADHVLMEQVAESSGIDLAAIHDNWKVDRKSFMGMPGGVYACDYNSDEWVDLLITASGPPRLYVGLGGARFEDTTRDAGLPFRVPVGDLAAFADLDNDGDEDLILGIAVMENVGGRFRGRGPLPLTQTANGFALADYDRDGLIDVYVSNVAPPPQAVGRPTSWVNDRSGAPNQLLRNRGDFRFSDVTAYAHAGAGARSTFTSTWFDADDDGWPDLYVINELGPNLLLHNRGNGQFEERRVGPEYDGFTMGSAAGDLDNDGRLDLYLANMYSKMGQRIIANLPDDAYPADIMKQIHSWVSGNLLLHNDGGLQFRAANDPLIGQVGWTYGPALVDLDADGWLDIYSTAGFASFSRDEPDG
jgi:hypothetical protein